MSRRATPPGSLGIGDSLRALRDPAFYRERSGQLGAVFRMAQFHRPVVVVTDLRLGMEVLQHAQGWLAHSRPLFGARQVVDQVAFLGNAAHSRYREAFERAIQGPIDAAIRDAIGRGVRRRLHAAAKASASSAHDPDEWIPALCDDSLSTATFGIDGNDARYAEVQREMRSMLAIGRRRWVWLGDHLWGIVALLGASMRSMDDGWRERSLLGTLLRESDREPDDVAIGNVALLCWATRSNVIGTVRWTLKELVDHPEIVGRIRGALASGDGTRGRDAARDFVREVLRLHQSEFFQREVIRELEVGGYRVPRRWLFRVAVSEGHRDPRVFEEPDVFRPERFSDREYAPSEYVPFSDGAHSAYGAELALTIAECLVETYARELVGHTVIDGPPARERPRHWSHWRPSKGWRLELALQ